MREFFLFLCLSTSLMATEVLPPQEHQFPLNSEDQEHEAQDNKETELTPQEEKFVNQNISDLSKLPERLRNKIPHIKKIKLTVDAFGSKPNFKEFSRLEEVDLSENRGLLKHFDFSTFPQNLKVLRLQNCALEKIPNLSKFEKLEVLDLSGNMFEVLDKKFLPSGLKN